MHLILILLSGFVATSLMTGFSYLVANWEKSQYREPQLLNILISTSPITPLKISKKSMYGWIIHYTIGFFFAVIFFLVWVNTKWSPSLLSGAILGLLAGIVGLTGWIIMFKLHPSPPRIDYKGFYIQIIPAHVIFGIGSTIPYFFYSLS